MPTSHSTSYSSSPSSVLWQESFIEFQPICLVDRELRPRLIWELSDELELGHVHNRE
ncbi:hypothetical protein PR003_g24801 [Phytophthora rubi]|uniref:Uncharacterized protein n=1 Tax=Phytophthora rubi TaxID=129364 RepID=A0A6A4CJI1_9STRA|nr:hypothetical protein PR003_g24801 [Phytophthora rubi]